VAEAPWHAVSGRETLNGGTRQPGSAAAPAPGGRRRPRYYDGRR
jgi:hypothetical protein